MVFKPQTFYGQEPSMSDPESDTSAVLETRVANALARAGDIDASSVSVTAVGAQIVLRGRVAYPEEVAIAQDIAERAAEGEIVQNFIVADETANPSRPI